MALGNKSVPIERQVTEIWRAAIGQSGDFMKAELSSSVFPLACRLVSGQINAQEAVGRFDKAVQQASASSFFIDLARRSLLRAAGGKWEVSRFAADVFSEIAGYYVSRDLASVVGAHNRVATPREALSLKTALKELTTSTAMEAGRVAPDGSNWTQYVNRVLHQLQATTGGTR